ncbi:hypothetical protein MKW92_017281 [Papaver armeniacum]|nr:hypothetical protein MKW92_017281 [Papaver armeniacum]
MDERLYTAALTDNVIHLHQLLYEDPLMLHSAALASAETPLHVASICGNLQFVKEMIRLKPEFAGELNQNGFGPVHLASANGHVEILKELLMVNRDHCRLKGRDKSTPLHYATVKGRIGVINELISCCEESFEDVTIRDETALHLAVKNNQFEALRIMVDMLRRLNKGEILNKKDQEGNRILHLATSMKQREASIYAVELLSMFVVELLLMEASSSTPLEVNLVNKSNLTALDYLLILPMELNDRDIEAMLRQAGAKRAQEIGQVLDIQILENYSNNQTEIAVVESPLDHSPSDARNALLVIVVLIATATYQAGLSPPGGVWQDTGNASNQTTIGSSNYVSTNTSGYAPGVSILSGSDAISFGIFLFFNSAGFYVSLFMIHILTCGFPLRLELQICIWAMGFTYSITMFTITPNGKLGIMFNVIVVLFPIGIPFMSKWIRVVKEKKPWKCLVNRINFGRYCNLY